MMSQRSKRELVAEVRPRYIKAKRTQKQQLLDELVTTTGYHRKYVIGLLKRARFPLKGGKAGRKRTYGSEVVEALEGVWRAANCIASKRFVPNMANFVAVLEQHGELKLSVETRRLLLQLSPATADRLLVKARRSQPKHGQTTTKPGTLLKQAIPIRTFAQWDEAKPGFMEVDLVAHCGDSTQGEYLNSLNLVDIATRWTEPLGLLNKSQAVVSAAIRQARERLPFPLLGLDSDNGSEFINHDLKRYCEQEHITFTRCRPYKKNDQAHIEQKNWTVVRQTIGYDRFEGQAACDVLNALYSHLRLYVNFFQPVMVLTEKVREGVKLKKRYDTAKTPYQRVLDSPDVSDTVKDRLRQCYATLNPLTLLRQIQAQQAALWQLAKAEGRESPDSALSTSSLN